MDIKTIKKKLNAVIGKSILLKAFIISILALAISYVLYYGLRDNLTYIGVDSSNLSYLKEFYKQKNQFEGTYYDEHKAEDKILVIPIKNSTPNDSIANLIDSLCLYEAKVIGIDCIFQRNSNTNDSISRIEKAVFDNADRIVLAQAYDNHGNIINNIFGKDSRLCFGLINSYGFDSIKVKHNINHKDLFYFAYQIAKKYDEEIFKDADSINLITNYSNIDIPYLGISNFMEEDKKFIKGKIVLIGYLNDVSDIHSTPFIIEGKEMISGIMLHAYAVYSLISQDYIMKRLSIGTFVNIIGFWLLTFVYSLVYVFLTDKKNKCIKDHYTALKCYRPLLLLILVPVLLYICYYLTTYYRFIPNVVPFLLSIFLINTFNDFLEQNINSDNYEKV